MRPESDSDAWAARERPPPSTPRNEGARSFRLSAGELYRACDPRALAFDTTDDVEPLASWLGQDVALGALEFGLTMDHEGYNVFVLGPSGSGRTSSVREMLQAVASTEPTPPDRCYVHDFENPRKPAALTLPPGRAPGFAREVGELVEGVRRSIPEALRSEEVGGRRAALLREHVRAATEALERYREELRKDPWVALVPEDGGFSVVPARGGEPLKDEAWRDLTPELREEILRHQAEAQEQVESLQREVRRLQEGTQADVQALHDSAIRAVVDPRIESLREAWIDAPEAVQHLERIHVDILSHGDRFATPGEAAPSPMEPPGSGEDFFRRYEVNVVVSHPPEGGAPVVEESYPSLRNLMGQVGGQMRFGVMVTDFTRIVGGAAHRANGGYLLLDAGEVLSHPAAWKALKRALLTGLLYPGDEGAESGPPVADVLEPRPVPARFKLVLVGEPPIYYLLKGLDRDFADLFKVKVEFASRVDRTPETERAYAAFLARQCHDLELPPLDASAAARVVEEGSRWAGDQRKLTTRFRDVRDLLVEAARRRKREDGGTVTAADVDRAVRAREQRERRPQQELLELIERGVLAFDPAGAKAGQLHGVAVHVGEVSFGRPIRVMASAFPGAGGVVHIEREAQLSGPIHSKGFLVLSGYLGRYFARDHPLLLSASLSFDQLYEEVEGDSASAAELYALLSAIGDVPIRQGIGVTGALNQEGTVLPVGGVTHKVEGFYAACERRGLTGEQGVLLPRRNADNLCLRREVRDAVEVGRFHVWVVDRVEDGWPILSGLEAGTADGEGRYPEGTVHHAVQERLRRWAEQWRAFGR